MEERKITFSINYTSSPKDNEIFITHKGNKYTEADLDKIRQKLIENYVPKHNYEEDESYNPEESLSEEKQKELNDWKTKMKASSWKSRQRSLRKKGKLEQYKIDALNKLGMLWDPRESKWEKQYVIFKKFGLCDEIEEWVKEQRELNDNNKISQENLVRLKLVDFPFKPGENENYPFTFNSLEVLEEKLRKKTRRLELKLIKNPPKKLNEKQKEIIRREKFINKQKKKRKESKKSKWAILRSDYVSIVNSFNKDLQHISLDDAKVLIDKIEKGKSMYFSKISDHIKNLIAKKKFTKYSLIKCNVPGHFLGNANYETSFLEEHRIFSEDPIDKYETHKQISEFTNVNDEKVRIYACRCLIDHFETVANPRFKSYQPVDQLIKLYKSRKDINGLIEIKEMLKKYPLLYELYRDKIDETAFKLKTAK
tara:strand:+ start:1777 stop:3048 length:1272 start_codon:yes stop_codon:yes gene_type:complete